VVGGVAPVRPDVSGKPAGKRSVQNKYIGGTLKVPTNQGGLYLL
jgi:hypothetical protein